MAEQTTPDGLQIRFLQSVPGQQPGDVCVVSTAKAQHYVEQGVAELVQGGSNGK